MNPITKLGTAVRLLWSEGPAATWAALRRNVRQLYLQAHGSEPFLYQNADGIRFVCDPSSSTSQYWYLSGRHYESAELEVCRLWVRPGDVCLDLGANIGQYAAALAPLVGAEGQVISVEPSPTTFTNLRRTCELLGLKQVVLAAVCVADQPGTLAFHAATGHVADISSSLGNLENLGTVRTVEVSSVSIDGLLRQYGVSGRVSLVKLDVEGAEALALAGGKSMLEGDDLPLFIVEVNTVALAGLNATPDDVLDYFPPERWTLLHGPCNEGDQTAQTRVGCLYPLPDPRRHPWPHCSNVVAVPRAGKFSARRAGLAAFLNQSA